MDGYEEKYKDNHEIVGLNIRNHDIKHIKGFVITRPNNYNYYGKTLKTDYDEICEYLEALGENPDHVIKALLSTIKQIVSQVTEHYNSEYKSADSIWLTIRATTVTNHFDIPRWHRDGRYFRVAPDELTHKFATVLKGPGTLYITDEGIVRLHDDMFNKERELAKEMEFDSQIERYKYLNERLRPLLAQAVGTNYQSVGDSKGIIFLVGNNKNGLIHSEPAFDTQRIFMSLLFGSYEQIKEWENR